MKPPVNILHFFTRKKSRENFKLPDAILLRTALTLSLTFHQHHKMMQTLETRRVKCARNSTSNCTYQHRCFLCVIMTQGKGFLPPDSHQQNVEQQQVVYWFCLNLCRNHWHRVHLDFYWIDISIKVNWALPLKCTLPWCLSSFLLFHSCFLFLPLFLVRLSLFVFRLCLDSFRITSPLCGFVKTNTCRSEVQLQFCSLFGQVSIISSAY